MKTLILIACLLQAIPKGTDTIVVKANFEQVKNALNANGYTVASYQKDFGVIKTDFKKVSNALTWLQLDIKIIGDSAYIGGNNEDNIILEYTRGGIKSAFLEMNRFALSIDSNLTYKTVR